MELTLWGISNFFDNGESNGRKIGAILGLGVDQVDHIAECLGIRVLALPVLRFSEGACEIVGAHTASHVDSGKDWQVRVHF